MWPFIGRAERTELLPLGGGDGDLPREYEPVFGARRVHASGVIPEGKDEAEFEGWHVERR